MTKLIDSDLFTRKIFPYYIDVEIFYQELYIKLVFWLRQNVPTVDRWIPQFSTVMLEDEVDAYTYRFRFRHEEDAMAFKLLIR